MKSDKKQYNNISEVQVLQLAKITNASISCVAWGEPENGYLKTGLLNANCIAILILDISTGMLYIMKDKRERRKIYYAIDQEGKNHAVELGLEYLKNIFRNQ